MVHWKIARRHALEPRWLHSLDVVACACNPTARRLEMVDGLRLGYSKKKTLNHRARPSTSRCKLLEDHHRNRNLMTMSGLHAHFLLFSDAQNFDHYTFIRPVLSAYSEITHTSTWTVKWRNCIYPSLSFLFACWQLIHRTITIWIPVVAPTIYNWTLIRHFQKY
jgi:hypothetical protein